MRCCFTYGTPAAVPFSARCDNPCLRCGPGTGNMPDAFPPELRRLAVLHRWAPLCVQIQCSAPWRKRMEDFSRPGAYVGSMTTAGYYPPAETLRVLVCVGSEMEKQGMRTMLESVPEVAHVEASNGVDDGIDLLRSGRFNVVIVAAAPPFDLL